MRIGQEVNWLECPGSIPAYHTHIRGLSPCGKYALLCWLRNPVPISTLKPLEVYHIVRDNHWGLDGVDTNTGDSLTDWVGEYERKSAIN